MLSYNKIYLLQNNVVANSLIGGYDDPRIQLLHSYIATINNKLAKIQIYSAPTITLYDQAKGLPSRLSDDDIFNPSITQYSSIVKIIDPSKIDISNTQAFIKSINGQLPNAYILAVDLNNINLNSSLHYTPAQTVLTPVVDSWDNSSDPAYGTGKLTPFFDTQSYDIFTSHIPHSGGQWFTYSDLKDEADKNGGRTAEMGSIYNSWPENNGASFDISWHMEYTTRPASYSGDVSFDMIDGMGVDVTPYNRFGQDRVKDVLSPVKSYLDTLAPQQTYKLTDNTINLYIPIKLSIVHHSFTYVDSQIYI